MLLPTSFIHLIDLCLIVIVANLCLLTLAGFLGRRWWFLDLPNHFRAQYFYVLLLVVVGFLALGRWWGVAVSLSMALVNFAMILPRFIPLARAASNGPIYRLLLSNVLMRNHSYDKVRDLVNRERPDLVILIEPNQAWLNGLAELRQDYPYWHTAPRKDAYGVAVFSRQPFDSTEVIHQGYAGQPTVLVRLRMSNHHNQMLNVIATHPSPPKGAAHSAGRNNQLQALAELARQQTGAVLLCGDLNLSPWSPYFVDLLREGCLVDSGRGFGLQPTWPANNFLLRTPIDHCLVSPQITVRHRRLGPQVGSDHLPVILDFSLTGSG
jgi:endonuclease/exonuclease/phosphatase (EEP) superfamily protein YafD